MLDIGCQAGGSLSCLNDGICLKEGKKNGTCECKIGFTGLTCHKCEFLLPLLILPGIKY